MRRALTRRALLEASLVEPITTRDQTSKDALPGIHYWTAAIPQLHPRERALRLSPRARGQPRGPFRAPRPRSLALPALPLSGDERQRDRRLRRRGHELVCPLVLAPHADIQDRPQDRRDRRRDRILLVRRQHHPRQL